MNLLQKYTWLINTIRRAGEISYKDLSDLWERNKELSDCKPLSRATFNRWRDAIFSQFRIIISCRKTGGYLYYIENPEEIDEDKLKKWMLDSFAVNNIIGENLSLADRIVVDEIPSGRIHLTTIIEAMKRNKVISVTYKPFKENNQDHCYRFTIDPYCLKLFENRWYVLGRNNRDQIRIYGLDRLITVEETEFTFKLPEDFSADEFFSTKFGVVIGDNIRPVRIILRAYGSHRHYLNSLPLHHSQKIINDLKEYTDFELYLSPTYDFIMKLLHTGAMIEVISPQSLRKTMKCWIADMQELYIN